MPYGDLDTCLVTGTYRIPDGTTTGKPATGTVRFQFPSTLLAVRDPDSDLIVVPQELTAQLNSLGQLYLTDPDVPGIVLPVTNDPDVFPTGFTYHVIEHITNAVARTTDREYDILIDVALSGGTLDLADVVNAIPLPDVSGYVLIIAFNDLVHRVEILEGGTVGGGIDGGVEL